MFRRDSKPDILGRVQKQEYQQEPSQSGCSPVIKKEKGGGKQEPQPPSAPGQGTMEAGI